MTKQLITISDNAAKRIKEILSNAESGVKGVRVSVKSGGCAGMEYEMTYLKETIPNDEVVKDNEVEVFIDPKAIMYLLGTKMDYKEDKFSSSFVFNEGGAGGTAMSGTITPAVGFHRFPANVGTSLYATIGSTLNVTFFYAG